VHAIITNITTARNLFLLSEFDLNPLLISAISRSFPYLKSLYLWPPSAEAMYAQQQLLKSHTIDLIQPVFLNTNKDNAPIVPIHLQGGLTIYDYGQFSTSSINYLETNQVLCPSGFISVRLHQSTINPNFFTRYLCSIAINEANELVFRVKAADSKQVFESSNSPTECWQSIATLIYDRTEADKRFRHYKVDGLERFGLTNPTILAQLQYFYCNSSTASSTIYKPLPLHIHLYSL
jgi:hypothetical protein